MRCPSGHRMVRLSSRGPYCWTCEQQARQAACSHVYDDPRWAGILGWRWYCECGDMYVGSLDERGRPPKTGADRLRHLPELIVTSMFTDKGT